MKRYTGFIVIGLLTSIWLIFNLKYTDFQTISIKSYAGVGDSIWSNIDLHRWFEVFKRDIAILGNDGGMRLPHQFALYTILRIIRPACVIESGIFKGVTTKIIRKTLPDAFIISLDPVCNSIKFQDKHEVYCGNKFSDFNEMGLKWSSIDKKRTIDVFDDHQSGFLRILQSRHFGFKFVVIEDNYPFKGGDNYSPKQVFSDVYSDVVFQDNFGRMQKRISREEHYLNRQMLIDSIRLYAEFPPLNKNMTVNYLSKHLSNQNSEADLYRMMVEGLEIKVPYEREYLLYHFLALIELKQ